MAKKEGFMLDNPAPGKRKNSSRSTDSEALHSMTAHRSETLWRFLPRCHDCYHRWFLQSFRHRKEESQRGEVRHSAAVVVEAGQHQLRAPVESRDDT